MEVRTDKGVPQASMQALHMGKLHLVMVREECLQEVLPWDITEEAAVELAREGQHINEVEATLP